MTRVRFELWEVQRNTPDLCAATCEGEPERAKANIEHYAMMYRQDGPVEIRGPFKIRSKTHD